MDQETELRILRKIVKLTLRYKTRLASQNEFNREISKVASDIGEEPEAIRKVITPILNEAFSEMLATTKEEREKGSRKPSIPSGDVFPSTIWQGQDPRGSSKG